MESDVNIVTIDLFMCKIRPYERVKLGNEIQSASHYFEFWRTIMAANITSVPEMREEN